MPVVIVENASQSGRVIRLPLGWLVRWVDKDNRERTTRLLSDCERHVATLAVREMAEQLDQWGDFLGEPVRVIRR